MFCPASITLTIRGLVGLAVLVTGLSLGKVNSSFAETGTDQDIIISVDLGSRSAVDVQNFNHFLNVFTAAFLESEGNLEVVVVDRNTICFSARTDGEGCSGDTSIANRHVVRNGDNSSVTILTTYDE